MPIATARNPAVPPKKVTSFRLSEELIRLLEALEADMGLTRTAAIEVAVRDFSRRHFRGRKPPEIRENPPKDD